jgi:DNA repair exonuclease SbcCD ATPase subunit
MITRLTMENFLPFRQKVVLDLADQGFVLIRGRNTVSQAADANGVGKTSIAHAICYALYGEDLSGRKADAVACRFTTGQCMVAIDLKDDRGEWGIVRTRRPARLMTYGIPGVLENEDAAVLQKKIEDRLGCGLRTFKNAVVFGQGAFDRFSHADQAEQMRMLDEIQGVDFREALKNAKDWRADLTVKFNEQHVYAEKARGHIEAVSAKIEGLMASRVDFEGVKRANVDRLRGQQEKIEDALDAGAAEEVRIAAEYEMLLALRAANIAVFIAERAENEARGAEEDAEIYLGDAERGVQEITDALDALEAAGACPTCRRGVKTKADRDKVRKLFAPTLAEAGKDAIRAASSLVVAQETSQEATQAAESARAAQAALVPVGEDASRLIARLEVTTGRREAARRADARASLEIDLADTRKALDEAQGAVWAGQAALAEAEAAKAAADLAERQALVRSRKIESAMAMSDYWVEAFGDRGIRSMLVDGVADYVNDRVREHLDVLAAGEATMQMSATTDLKKGGTKERISFKPEWSWGGIGTNDESGGQERRMDLAVFAAVQDLAETRSARPFPLKIWDEPTDGLDSRGMELFTQWVAHQARTRGTGLLISHNKEVTESVTPDRIWTVVLDDDGAHVEVA